MSGQGEKTQRVLFIGIVQDGKVVQERPIPHGEDVTVGSSANASFVLADVGQKELGTDAFPLFAFRDGAYVFRYTKAIKGRITSRGEKIELAKALADGTAKAVDGVYELPLSEQDKGKVKVGASTVLFKFEQQTVLAPAPVEKLDFRPRLLPDEDDRIFGGLLGFSAVMAVLFGVWVAYTEVEEPTIEDLPPRVAQILLTPPTELPKAELVEPSDEGQAVAEQKPEPEQPKPEAVEAPKTERAAQVAQAQRIESAKAALQDQSPLFAALAKIQAMGTTGEGKGTVLVQEAGGDVGGLSEQIAMAERAVQNTDGGVRLRGGSGGGTGPIDLGGVSQGVDASGAATRLGEAPKVEVKGTVEMSEVDFGGGDVTSVAKVVKKYKGQLNYCYEKSLKANPSMRGRVVVRWTIENGRATDIAILENTTGDAEFVACIESRVRRWSFEGVEDGEATTPFVFAPQE